MESPRLRLLILGALRGLIKPGYDFGLTSVIREELLMRALAREIDGQTFYSRAVVEASVLSSIAPSAQQRFYRRAVSYLFQGNAMVRLQPMKDLRKIHLSKTDSQELSRMGTFLKVLKETDFYEKMDKTLKAER